MEQLLAQVRRARRKLAMELFLNRLVSCWFAGLVLAAVAIAIPKITVVENLPENWPWNCALIALVGGFLIASLWTFFLGKSELDAAVEIDSRYDLKERIASSLSLSPTDAESPAGQALVADAVRASQRVDIDEKFRIRFQRRPWLPLVPALAMFLITVLADNREAQSSVDPATQKITKEQHDNATKALRERLKELRKKAKEKKEFKDAEDLFSELEEQADKMSNTRTPDRKKSLVKLNDLAKDLEKRRDQLNSKKDLRKQFEKLDKMNRGPADKMLDAMKNGDMKKAMKELEKLKQKMTEGKLGEKEKQELQNQLEQMKNKLQESVEQQQKAMEELKKQIEQKKQQGDLSKAGELQEKLDKMQQQQNNMQKLNDLTQKMGECQQCMQQGDAQGAAQAMQEMMDQMEQMQQQMAEGEMLDAALDQIQMAKDAMRCGDCQGNQPGNQSGNQFGNQFGNGMGQGKGGGTRPDEKNDVGFRDTRVKQDPRKGSAVIVGETDGPNIRGTVAESVKEQMVSQGSEPADPLTMEQLPKSRREHAEEYFNSLREGR